MVEYKMSYKLNTNGVSKTTPNPKDIEYDFEYEKDKKIWEELIAPFKCKSEEKVER